MRVLIVGSLDGQVGAAAQIAIMRGATVAQADDVNNALRALRAGEGADVVLIDVQMDVGKLTEGLLAERITIPVVACGIGTDRESAVRAIRAGAVEYIPLPPSAELISAVLTAVAEEPQAIVYRDPMLADVLKLADQVAASTAGILITGASGTGKELLARYLHKKSHRSDRRFVAVNCAAIPENLLESELFGHEKGAFTGAVARRIGKFEEASGGTLLLDEISEMDPRLQAKLLRVIQESEIDRVGGTKPVKVDVRIIATTNRILAEEVAKGTFREDLYFRLNVINLDLPTLRERPADIGVLAEHFIKKYALANGVKPLPLSEAAKKKLIGHPWPGNVRELENSMHRTVLLASGTEIDPEAILLTGTPGAPAGTVGTIDGGPASFTGRTVADVERDLIIDTLHHCLGNRTHAANILGISIRTLRNKLKQYNESGFSVPVPGESERPAV
jgi:DNA-binding NtrC family response regulator